MSTDMKFGKTVLIEIMSILQRGLTHGIDISQALRDIRVENGEDDGSLELTDEYVEAREEREKNDESWDDGE